MTTQLQLPPAIQDYLAALGAGDATALKACFTSDCTWVAPEQLPSSGTWEGPDAIVDGFFPIAAARMVPGTFTTQLLSATTGAANVVLEWEASAEVVGGGTYRNTYIANFLLRGSRICGVREYFDTQRGASLYATAQE